MSDKASLMQQPAPLADVGLQRELAALFVQALNLEMEPKDIDPDAPLYGEGLGLDSIDILQAVRHSTPRRRPGESTDLSVAPALSRVHCGPENQVNTRWARRLQFAA